METEFELINERELAEAYAEGRRLRIQAMRQLLDFLEARPELPFTVPTVMASIGSREEMRQCALALGEAEKEYEGNWFNVYRMFGPIKYEVFCNRELVCEKRVVGTRTVPEHTEEVVEWECGDSLLAQ